jgi:hypothetical protein
MDYYDSKKSLFYRSFMTSVFVGIFITLATMFYDIIFVEYLKFPLSAIINVSSLIFAVNLLFLVIGAVYYFFVQNFRKGDVFFIALFTLLTIFLVIKAFSINRTDDEKINVEFRYLLSGIIIITGIGASFVIPYLFHNKKFEDAVL